MRPGRLSARVRTTAATINATARPPNSGMSVAGAGRQAAGDVFVLGGRREHDQRKQNSTHLRNGCYHVPSTLIAIPQGCSSQPLEQGRRQIALGEGGDDRHDLLAGHLVACPDFVDRIYAP